MAKTPQRVVQMLERHRAVIDHIDEVLQAKRKYPIENQAEHVRKSEDYWIGRAEGANAAIEDALFLHKCYAGFMYMSPLKKSPDGTSSSTSIQPGDADFAEWRRLYFTKV